MQKFVAYYRVSTGKQGASGLGLEAQQATARAFVEARGGNLVGEYREVESGAKGEREQLQAAMRDCRLKGATLLIAKLDRLSRDLRFLLSVKGSGVRFVCCDNPEANELTINLLAIIAEHERKLISERTRAALTAAKARGVKLGNPQLDKVRNVDTSKANATRVAKGAAFKDEIRAVVNAMRQEQGDLSATELARQLNAAGYRTPRNKEWTHVQINRL